MQPRTATTEAADRGRTGCHRGRTRRGCLRRAGATEGRERHAREGRRPPPLWGSLWMYGQWGRDGGQRRDERNKETCVFRYPHACNTHCKVGLGSKKRALAARRSCQSGSWNVTRWGGSTSTGMPQGGVGEPRRAWSHAAQQGKNAPARRRKYVKIWVGLLLSG